MFSSQVLEVGRPACILSPAKAKDQAVQMEVVDGPGFYVIYFDDLKVLDSEFTR